MKPSEMCKKAGLAGLQELANLTEVGDRTLINWHKHKPQLFRIVILGAAKWKEEMLPVAALETPQQED